MKTVIRRYKVYTFDELSQEAKDKAREDYNQYNGYMFLQDDLREYIHEELEDLGYKVIGVSTTEKPSIRPFYSLSNSQGDGLMFEATLEDKKGNIYVIKHKGHYYNERSTNITATNQEGNEIDSKDFEENVYVPLCKRIAQRGYDEIAYQESEEVFQEVCESNDYTFIENGEMFN